MNISAETVAFYTTLQRRLHWLVLVLIAGQFAVQKPMSQAMQSIERGESLGFMQFFVTTFHTWSGIAIAALMIWRWQLRRRYVPVGAGKLSPAKSKLVRLHHLGLYVVVGIMALSGALHYYAEVKWAAQWHEWSKWLLLGLIGVHIAGALSHIGNGEKVFQRMMGRDSLR